MTTITKDRLLTIQHWRETYGPGSNVVLPAEEAEELARIALASLAAVSDERAAYELFMEKRFGESVDRRRAKNGDREYMAWDMALGWIIWCHRAAMLQAGNFRENKNSSTNNFREISETSTNSPVTPDSWISCSERMPEKGQNVLISVNFDSSLAEPLICSARYTGSTFRRGQITVAPGNGIEQATHWMPLPEPPQEVNRG
ncbi:DUF551 domain-containing protein [Escherichia coli]|uniref:DUF551 domain-containing protein n=3 Tax=Escherichia coli TaxID=562 RepID=UPI00025C8F8C|nr:DUF551 domain-containing protein [Escherichia coli]EKK2845752.1 DUF551 domain-containing protein [Escherichia coli O157]EEQ9254420.1 DUF551 domain-containing protein [Escherichia coli]EER6421407.1 DUF551 domain-containing protein [Escherichia coli]EEZ6373870.1 DUF551 domain-containing protein [Escherichia coli]EFF8579908.1 DUF551 domain-containing protein [Escherichia coli]